MNVLFGRSSWNVLAMLVFVGALAGAGTAVLWPRTYHSSAVIRVASADHRSEMPISDLSQTVMSAAALEQIIGAHRLYADTSMSGAEKLETVRRHIRMSVSRPDQSAIMIQYVASSPITAQQVTEALVNIIKTAHPRTVAFDVIAPASLDKDPISPNVLNVIFTGTLAGLLCGFLVIALTKRIRREPPLRHA